jgi:hypothetical protein
LGKPVATAACIGTNLFRGVLTGRSVAGALHLANKALAGLFAKKQAAVEMVMLGSELVATRTATEQTAGLRVAPRCLGVPVRDKSCMFGGNKPVVSSAIAPHAKLHKRHSALPSHRAREATAGKFIAFHWVGGSLNPADALGKHWGHQVVRPLLQALPLWEGDAIDLFGCQKRKQAEHQTRSGLSETEQSNLAREEKN